MRGPDDMPPDPFAEDGVDLMSLTHAEELARRGIDPDHPAWDRFDGPDMFDFDEAARELAALESGEGADAGSDVRYAIWKTALAGVAVVVVIALLVVYVF